jgi:hypothetical protein
MATLAAQIKTDYDLLIVTPHYDDTDLTRVSQIAAARVIRYGGNDSDTDTAAVDLGLDYMIYLVQKRFALLSDEAGIAEAGRLEREFMDFRAGRRQVNSDPISYDSDGDVVTV